MAYEACLSSIQAAAGGRLTDDQMTELLDDLVKRKRRILGESPLKGDEEARRQAAKELSEEAKVAALIEKRSRAINVLRKQENMAFTTTGDFAKNSARGLQAVTVGVEGKEAGSGFSQDAQGKAVAAGLLGPMIGELDQAGLLKILRAGVGQRLLQTVGLGRMAAARFVQFEKDVARELWRIDDPEGIMRPSPASGNKQAEAAAKIIHKWQETSRLMQNEAGAWIRKMPGYIVRQGHDQFRVAGRGRPEDYKAWRDTILPRLDERTFDHLDSADPNARENFLHGTWMSLASGVHERPSGDWLGGFKGPGNLAKKASQERELHFKSADDWFAYNDAYGTGSLFDSAIYGLSKSARNIAALRVWGTNPEAAFTRLREELIQRAKDAGDLKQVKELQKKKYQDQFEAANGITGIPDNPTAARIMSNVRGATILSKLGGVVLSSVPDFAVATNTLKHNGVGFLERVHAVTFGSAFRGKLSGSDQRVMSILGAAADGMVGSISGRFAATDSFHGRMSKLQDLFMRVNLLNFHTTRLKEGVAMALSHHLALESPKSFDALDPKLQVSLRRYGIEGDTWNLIRGHLMEGEGGRNHLTTDVADHIDDDEIRSYLRNPEASSQAINRARTDIRIKLGAFFNETARDALTEPGARERAAITRGTKPGTLDGEFMRAVGLFKSFPLTFITRQLGRNFMRADTKFQGAAAVASLIATTTALGYISDVASGLARGKSPKDPRDLATWNAALLKGGGLGIYGDFLFGTSNRFGQSLLETAAGPALGTLSDFKRVIDAAVTGQDWKASAYRFGINNAPFVNLFYTRMALDYLINYQVQEMLNPGFLQRMERNVQNNSGQKFLIRPSQAIPYGGGNRIFEGVR